MSERAQLGIDGNCGCAHHKTWVIDQMVRALLDVPMVNVSAKDGRRPIHGKWGFRHDR